MRKIKITRPDDWHVHLRDADQLKDTVTASAKHFARALVMPNLKPALTSVKLLNDYRERIIKHLPKESKFTPYMTLYLNEMVTTTELIQASQSEFILGAKLYPAGVTTNSLSGARSIKAMYPLFEIMQKHDLVLQIHGEINDVDIFKREQLFIEQHLIDIIKNFPKLRIILEHISTRYAVEFITSSADNIAATITPHHLVYNRNQLFNEGINPHYFCMPILKEETDQLALQQAAISGNPKFFAGTDSAPHPQHLKESNCGCAGIFSAPFALAIYAECFAKLNHLDKLNNFMSKFGADFYQLPVNEETIVLIEKEQVVPNRLPLGNNFVVPIAAGQTLAWSCDD